MPRPHTSLRSDFQVNLGGNTYVRFTPKEEGAVRITVTPTDGATILLSRARARALMKVLEG